MEYKPLKPQIHKCPKYGKINKNALCMNCLKIKIGYKGDNNGRIV